MPEHMSVAGVDITTAIEPVSECIVQPLIVLSIDPKLSLIEKAYHFQSMYSYYQFSYLINLRY